MSEKRSILSICRVIMSNSHDILPNWHAILCKYRLFLSNSSLIKSKTRSFLTIYRVIMSNSADILPNCHAILSKYRLFLSNVSVIFSIFVHMSCFYVKLTWYLVNLSNNFVPVPCYRKVLLLCQFYLVCTILYDIPSNCHGI